MKNYFAKKYCASNMQAGISGGGSLPMHIDKFFEVRDITIILLFVKKMN